MWENTLPRRGIIYELKLDVKLSLKGESPEEGSTEGVQLGWWQGGGWGGTWGAPRSEPALPSIKKLAFMQNWTLLLTADIFI